MSWFGFHAWSYAWLLGLLAPVVLFYFLKLKRPRQIIPSLYLWRQVLNDQRVNSPFQRFKRNLLLLLQLLLLLLVCLAAMQPFWRGRPSRMRRLPILIDSSASMAALDKEGGVSRLEEAKRRVRKLIDDMLKDQEICLVAFARTARRCTPFTSNKRELRNALGQIEIEDVPSDIEDALRMAQALAQTVSFEEVLLFSDGNFPTRADFELSFDLNYQRLPPAGANIGITALNATRSASGVWSVFVQVEGTPGTTTTAALELLQDGQSMLSQRLSVGAERPEQILFEAGGEAATTIEVRLAPDGFDSLASDNVAYVHLPATRLLWVYCPPSLASYRHALPGLGTVRLFPEEGAATSSETRFDLVVTDNAQDLALEAPTRLTVGLVPDDLKPLLTMGKEGTAVVDWRRNAELFRYVELSDLVLLDQPQSKPDVRDADYETHGYDILAHGHRGPLVLEKREGQLLTWHLLFHTDRSTLPYRIGFPILVANAVQIAMERTGLAKAEATRTGILPHLALEPNRAYQVTGPRGEGRQERSDQHGTLAGIPAPRVGHYRVTEGGTERARLSASLLSPRETRLAGVEEIRFNEELAVAASKAPPLTDRSLWWTLGLLAFGVLLGEWWYFQRRPGGFAR